MSENSKNQQPEQAQEAQPVQQAQQARGFVNMQPRRLQLPDRPQAFGRANRKADEADGAEISIELYSQDALDKHGQECASAVGAVLEPEIARLNAIASLFAEKLKSLGVDPKAIIQEEIAKQAAAKTK